MVVFFIVTESSLKCNKTKLKKKKLSNKQKEVLQWADLVWPNY